MLHVATIQSMLDGGVPFASIEEWIDGRDDIDTEQKAALWLYAWTGQPSSHQRDIVDRTLRDTQLS